MVVWTFGRGFGRLYKWSLSGHRRVYWNIMMSEIHFSEENICGFCEVRLTTSEYVPCTAGGLDLLAM